MLPVAIISLKKNFLPSDMITMHQFNVGALQSNIKSEEDAEIESIFKEPYWHTGERSFVIPPGASKTVTVHFLPFILGTHNCQVS